MMRQIPKWTWGILPVYNGFSHDERVQVWQMQRWCIDNGWYPKAEICSISGETTGRVQYHSEDYYDWPTSTFALKQTFHLTLHQRFKRPDPWRAIVDRYAVTGHEWFAVLPMEPVDLAAQLRAEKGEGVADIFGRAPAPAGIVADRNRMCLTGAVK